MNRTSNLNHLDPHTFEHLVNALATAVLGQGHTGFGPGPDGGRDGFFEGEAPYPSATNHWNGVWYIQAKFHAPHLSHDPQKWLRKQIESELEAFQRPSGERRWPDNWIIATNIDPSGTPMTGAFDRARELVRQYNPRLAERFHIWGGAKIIHLLDQHSHIRSTYAHLVTPGHVLTALLSQLEDSQASAEQVIRSLIVHHLNEQQYAKLEQAGSDADTRPTLDTLFVDLPLTSDEYAFHGFALDTLMASSAAPQAASRRESEHSDWHQWGSHPRRARVLFMKGGPGQGKSTITQFLCQIHRSAFLLQSDRFHADPQLVELATNINTKANALGQWPLRPRIPIYIELKDYASWLNAQPTHTPKGVLTHLASKLTTAIEEPVSAGILRRLLSEGRWVVIFDGLDEVSDDVKDCVAEEVYKFTNDVAIEVDSDLLCICTSRPQGYSGQFDALGATELNLTHLNPDQSFQCALPVLRLNRTTTEATSAEATLTDAVESTTVQELMRTPLQSHIMAVIMRDGTRPPERRWALYNTFYEVIRRREANRDIADKRISRLLREEQHLLRTLHNRVGFVLHAEAETAGGVQTSITRDRFREIARHTVHDLRDDNSDAIVETLVKAAATRLVLLNTPDDGEHLRFDIRQLQEFFAGEFIYASEDTGTIQYRLSVLGSDPHWRECVHFAVSALVESNRVADLSIAADELAALNEDPEDGTNQTLYRRLGRGALMAARLLQEGVLEDDKRIRQKFHPALTPIAGLWDDDAVSLLIETAHPGSRKWLAFVCKERMGEARPRMAMGALIASLALAGNGDADTPLVDATIQHLSSLDNAWKGLVARQFDSVYLDMMGEYKARRKRIPEWLVNIAREILESEQWLTISDMGHYSVLYIATSHITKTEEDDAEQSRSDATPAELLWRIIHDCHFRRRAHVGGKDDADTVRIGPVVLTYMKNDWTTSAPPPFLKGFTAEEFSQPQSGVLELVRRLVLFALDGTASRLSQALTYIDSNGLNALNALPILLRGILPAMRTGEDVRSIVQACEQVGGESRICEQLNDEMGRYGGMERVVMSIGIKSSVQSDDESIVDGIAKHARHLVPPLLCTFAGFQLYPFHRLRENGRAAPLDGDRIKRRCCEVLADDPVALSGCPWSWNEVALASNAYNVDTMPRLRSYLKGERPGNAGVEMPLLVADKIVSLDLPEDGPLLPWLALSVSAPRLRRYPISQSRVAAADPHMENSEIVRKMFPNVQGLRALLVDGSSTSEAAAAGVMLLLHPDRHEDDLGAILPVVTSPENKKERWLIKSVCNAVGHVGDVREPTWRRFVGEMMNSLNEDAYSSDALQDLVVRWRETSRSAVTRTGGIDEWMAPS